MKKIFLLIPALFIAMMMNAKEIEVSSGTSNIIHYTIAASGTADGDVLVLTDAGPYVSTKADGDDYTKLSKNVTIKAKAGITPVIKLEVPIQARDGKSAKFIGIKFDGSSLQYDHYIYFKDAYDNSLEFEDCEFYNSSKYIVSIPASTKAKSLIFKNCKFYNNSSTRGLLNQGTIEHLELDGCEVSGFVKEFLHGYSGASHVDECIVNDCYFHNNSRSAVMFVASTVEGQQTCDQLTVTNSTFANINATGEYESVIDARPYGSANTDAIKVLVDHCTFYNNTTINSDHANIRTNYLTDVTVSNCIFAHSEEYARRATYCTGGGNINNCLTYNYTAEGTKGHAYGVTVNAASAVADPLFTDAANGDFSFANNWVTMNISPAIGAATDGTDLGDPRWHTAGTLPTTDFASPYLLKGNKAKLSGNIWYDGVNDYLYGDGGSNKVYGTATWKLHAERACVVGVALNLNAGNTSGHSLSVEILDADGNSIGEFAEAASTLPGVLSIPAEGDYTIILRNATEWSSVMIDNITLSYVGGDVQNMPGTTDIADAWFSSNGTRENGKISYSSVGSGCWAKWNINVAAAGTYNVTVNIQNVYGHNYVVEFLKEGETTPISIGEGEIKYGHDATLYPVEVGAIALEAGNYEMKVFNDVGDAALLNVTLAYAGGAAIDLSKAAPAELLANADAILSDDWSIEEGKIVHAESKALTGWAKWNVDCADAGTYNVTVNISCDNGHLMRVEVFEDENDPAVYTLDEAAATKWDTGDLAIDLGNIALDNKEYVFKVSNTQSSSHVQIAGVNIVYVGGETQNIPGTIELAEAILSTNAYRDANGLHFSDADHKAHVDQEWAKWNIHAAAGAYKFTFGVNGPDHGVYVIKVLDGENEIFADTYGKSGNGSYTTAPIYLDGNYVVQMQNTNNYSEGYMTSLSAAVASDVLIVDEMATDMQYINDVNGQSKRPLLKRTFVANMYNTVVFPFNGVTDEELTSIFGAGYELLAMTSAQLEGNTLNLNFAPVDLSQNTYGTPYLIKPTQDVVNPMFSSKTIYKSTSHLIVEGTNANFIGSYIKGEVPAGESNLFLGPNNTLYFSQTATPIKGMRAYFQVKGVSNPSNAIKHARIVMNGHVATDIENTMVNGKCQNGKYIENGQLVIIRDGVRYNVMGAKLQ